MYNPLHILLAIAHAVGRGAWLLLRRLGLALVAAIIVFEEWGWRPLSDALARLARFAPIAALERMIRALPPYAALIVFGLPTLLLLPLKLLALALIAGGHTLTAAALFLGAKVAGTAIVARLFILTQPQLMRIPWFARLYGIVMPWKQALTAWARDTWVWRMGSIVRVRLVRRVQALRASLAPRVAAVRLWLRGVFARQRQPRQPLALPAPAALAERSCPRSIAVIFEVEPAAGERERYLDMAARLRPELERIDGFISVERFQSLTNPSKLLSLSLWRDEAALAAWRNVAEHRRAQAAGRSGVFAGYRLRVAAVVRDYGLDDRDEAPADSRSAHGPVP